MDLASISVLGVSRHHAELAGQEMVGRPGTANRELAVFQLLGRAVVAVLIFFHRFGVDQVGDIHQHAVGIRPACN